jgi:hypothetical protein
MANYSYVFEWKALEGLDLCPVLSRCIRMLQWACACKEALGLYTDHSDGLTALHDLDSLVWIDRGIVVESKLGA